MKTILTISLTALLPLITISQDSIRYFNYKLRDTTPETARYIIHIAKTDSLPYTKWYDKHEELLKEGNFNFTDTVKNGYWKIYEDNKIWQEGRYLSDSMHGNWIFYHPSGKICGKVKFNDNDVVEEKYLNEDGDTVPSKLANRMAQFRGGTYALMRYISSQLRYPPTAKRKKIQGRVFVQFVIDKTGAVTRTKVLKSVHPLLDREAYRVISTLPKWTPAKMYNQLVLVSYQVPINFKFE